MIPNFRQGSDGSEQSLEDYESRAARCLQNPFLTNFLSPGSRPNHTSSDLAVT
uniref:Uncharacterized protein n=1 Tax=Macrostomum lignano TaxID=282301 RepID=A0A1I8FLK1_9PLAT